MNYNNKYLKYKNKYNELQKKNLNKLHFGGSDSKGFVEVKTIFNSGSLEGMSNQCFWISILDYLKKTTHPNATLLEVRTIAGLDASTQHQMFSIGGKAHKSELYYAAVNKVAAHYGLTIHIFTASHTGLVNFSKPRAIFGSGSHYVPIAQFGLGHFQLIDSNGSKFIPAVEIDGVIQTISPSISSEKKDAYLLKSEEELNIELNTIEKKKIEAEGRVIFNDISKIHNDPNIAEDQKREMATKLYKKIEEKTSKIALLEKNINASKQNILSYNLIIKKKWG
jgi:hypothetical protein